MIQVSDLTGKVSRFTVRGPGLFQKCFGAHCMYEIGLMPRLVRPGRARGRRVFGPRREVLKSASGYLLFPVITITGYSDFNEINGLRCATHGPRPADSFYLSLRHPDHGTRTTARDPRRRRRIKRGKITREKGRAAPGPVPDLLPGNSQGNSWSTPRRKKARARRALLMRASGATATGGSPPRRSR